MNHLIAGVRQHVTKAACDRCQAMNTMKRVFSVLALTGAAMSLAGTAHADQRFDILNTPIYSVDQSLNAVTASFGAIFGAKQ